MLMKEGREKARREMGLTRPSKLNYRMIWPQIREELYIMGPRL